jgi:hypothetical protein
MWVLLTDKLIYTYLLRLCKYSVGSRGIPAKTWDVYDIIQSLQSDQIKEPKKFRRKR